MSEDTGKQFPRRNVLKKIGTTAAVGAGLGFSSGSASAIEMKGSLQRRYQSPDVLQAAFRQHADGIVETLRAEGLASESFDLDSLTFEVSSDDGLVDPSYEDGTAQVAAVKEQGTFTAVGSVSTSSNGNEISLFVQPEREEAYAFVDPSGSEETLLVTEDDVGTEACVVHDCGACCTTDYEEEIEYHCYDNCTECYVYDTVCSGCYNDYCA